MKSLAEALQQEPGARIQEPEDSASGTHRINPRKLFCPAMRNCLPSAPWILAPGSSCSTWHDWRYGSDFDASEELGCSPVYEPIVTTGLIASPDLVIVLLSGVIKKYK
jgi:hypothetical protein